MKANVSTLLRDFTKIRRAALAGEEVIIETREGNLRITADRTGPSPILGSMKDTIQFSDDQIATPTTRMDEWNPSL